MEYIPIELMIGQKSIIKIEEKVPTSSVLS